MQINWANDKTWFHVFDPRGVTGAQSKGVTGAQSKGVTDIDPKGVTGAQSKGGLGKCMIQLSEEELEAVED